MCRQTSKISHTKSQTYMFFVSSFSCLCAIYWSQVLSREWGCSWSSADRRCSNYISVINNFITYWGATYFGDLTVVSWHSSAVLVRFGNGQVTSSYTLVHIWSHIHAVTLGQRLSVWMNYDYRICGYNYSCKTTHTKQFPYVAIETLSNRVYSEKIIWKMYLGMFSWHRRTSC